VKTGSGAFMKKEEDGAFLAKLMVETGERMGKKVVALITDMNQPLGRMVGNSLEVAECIAILRGEGPDDLRDLCLELAAWMFHLGGSAANLNEAKSKAETLLKSGRAMETFRKMVELQGGDTSVIDDPQRLPQAKYSLDVTSPRAGYVTAIQCESIGTACVILGGGREKKEDSVDPAVGITLHKKVGDHIVAGEPLCSILYNSEALAIRAKDLIEESYRISNAPPAQKRPLVHRVIQGSGNKN